MYKKQKYTIRKGANKAQLSFSYTAPFNYMEFYRNNQS